MRFFEIILLLLGVILPFVNTPQLKVLTARNIQMISIIGVLLCHIVFEGTRWQMTPIYIIDIIAIICLAKGYFYFKGNWIRKITSGLFWFIMLALGFAFSNILPVFDFATPTGGYEVGAEYLHFISEEDEYMTKKQGDKRELMVKVWYPAIVTDGRRETYLNDGERKGFTSKYGLPQSSLNYLDYVKTNTYTSPTISEGSFPVIIFSHGYFSNATGYQALIEEIVSHGYIVLNINHTYESVGSLFPSGDIKLYDVEYDREHNNEEMGVMVWEAMQAYNKATNEEEKRGAIMHSLKNYYPAEVSERWTQDINMIVDQIPAWNQSAFLSNHMDITKIGVIGHSQGGTAAGEALLENPKIRAGINIDGVQWGNMIDTFLSKPFLLLSSDWPEEHPDYNQFAYQNGSTSDFYWSKLKNSGHSNFMDIPFMVNLSAINEAGSIDPNKAIEQSSQVVLQFFGKYLKNEETDLLELSTLHPDIEISRHNGIIEYK